MPRVDHLVRAQLEARNQTLAAAVDNWRSCAKRAEASFEQMKTQLLEENSKIKGDYEKQISSHCEQEKRSKLDVSRMEERLRTAESKSCRQEAELERLKKVHAAELPQLFHTSERPAGAATSS